MTFSEEMQSMNDDDQNRWVTGLAADAGHMVRLFEDDYEQAVEMAENHYDPVGLALALAAFGSRVRPAGPGEWLGRAADLLEEA